MPQFSGKNIQSKCISCGNTGALLFPHMRDHLFGVSGSWTLIKCKHCGLVWLHPQPSPEEIPGFYKAYHTHQAPDHIPRISIESALLIPGTLMGYRNSHLGVKGRARGRRLSMVGPIREIGKRSVMWLSAHPGGKLLDIGCGNGVFLFNMQKHGWNVYGVETDPKAVQNARKKFNLEKIHLGTLEDAGLTDATFDAITMNHVIEHMLDPIDAIKNCFRLLKPGGVLVIATPNAESIGAMHFKSLWRGWEPPRHIHIFSPRSLSLVAEQAGFHIVSNSTPSGASYPIWMLSMLLRKKVFLKKDISVPSKRLKLKSAMACCVEDVLFRLGFQRGEELVLLARRPQ
ncbi:MAG: class I SAM-dependent methyltransferase [Desulfobacteraceae bacterium]|jgi:2-polyprenyl-3-methyl-5-hydroxy-6-metoxy-1,4-benzoquinol methylase|nr:class I SAM-dependent methyltransferase [Desulfobacteraceae bacterium]